MEEFICSCELQNRTNKEQFCNVSFCIMSKIVVSLHHNLKLNIMNDIQVIQSKIYEIRGVKVMLDRDLAAMYGVETRRLNEQVKRNIERFPEDFMFQLTKGELELLRSQLATSNPIDNQKDRDWTSQNATSNFAKMGLRRLPYAFTELGVAMLSSVLRSPLAIQLNMGNK